MKVLKFTVIGVCEEQRHAFHVKAENAHEAEIMCKNDHDGETSYHLVVAGVLRGHRRMVDTEDEGLDKQFHPRPGLSRPCVFVRQKDMRRRGERPRK